MGSINVQQMPKSRGFLECWKPRPGYKLVQLDFTSIEPVVLTAASRDPSLLKVYGADAKPQDIYLFTGAGLGSLGRKIQEHYDVDNTTVEMIAHAKKVCKKERNIAKTVHLAATYNAFPRKIFQTLSQAGVDITLEEVEHMHRDYWILYQGVKRFESDLIDEWNRTGGYILNGLGRPIAISHKLVKDAVNRYCQSTGHDLLMMYITRVGQLRDHYQAEMYPWLVDFHDETIWEVPEGKVDVAKMILEESLVWLNKHRQTDIPVKGDVQIADTLADIKIEE
jgi:DNA polymerase I-like protein with 3'-5' exonuclease and polymerase domains